MLFYKVYNDEGLRGVFECENFDDFLAIKDKYVEEGDEIEKIDQDEFNKLAKELDNNVQVTYVNPEDPINYTEAEYKIMILNWFKSFEKEIPSVAKLDEYFRWLSGKG